MSLIHDANTKLNKIIGEIEELLIEELNTNSDALCFYNDEIKVFEITEDDLIDVISPLDTQIRKSISNDTLGYRILLEHTPTGILIDYYIYLTNTLDYPSFKFLDDEKVHRILKVFRDAFTADYLLIENNPELFDLLDNLTFKVLMYQDFKKLLGNKNEN